MAITERSSPNPITASFGLGFCVLTGERRYAAITRNDTDVIGAFPFASNLFQDTDVVSILVARGDGEDFVSVRRMPHAWSDADKAKLQEALVKFTSNGTDFFPQAAQDHVRNLRSSFAPLTLSDKAVEGVLIQVMLPQVKSHGGHFEIIAVHENDDKTVDAEIFLEGSCSGCGAAATATLNVAKAQLAKVFMAISSKNNERTFGRLIVHDTNAPDAAPVVL